MRRFAVLLVCCLLGSAKAHAEDAQVREPEPGVLPTLAATVPGFLVPGAGAFVAKDRRAARNLAIVRGSAFAAFLASGALIARTGTSRHLVGALAPVTVMGGGVFLVSWLADIYAASTGGRDARVASWTPRLEAELGPRYVYDPQFAYRNFAYGRVDARVERLRVSPSAWIAMDDRNQRLALDVAVRLFGKTPSKVVRDGTYLDVASALTYHRYESDGFRVWTPELRLDGRVDLARFGSSLRGAFAEGQLGAGLEVYDFDGPGTRSREDAFGLLLARFGFGLYFGDAVRRTSEVLLYYDHRHDDFAAGMGVAGIGSGVLGHVGLSAHTFLTERFGVSLLAEVGSAVVVGLGLKYRLQDRTWGEPP